MSMEVKQISAALGAEIKNVNLAHVSDDQVELQPDEKTAASKVG